MSLQWRRSLPQKLDPLMVKDDLPSVSFVTEDMHVGEEDDDGGSGVNPGGGGSGVNPGGGGRCVLIVVMIKVFMVAVLVLSTKKLALGITLSAFVLLFLELAVARLFTLVNFCSDAHIKLDSLIGKLIEKPPKEEASSLSRQDRRNKVSFETVEESKEETIEVFPQSNWDDSSPVEEEKEVQKIRDVLLKNEKSYKKKKKKMMMKIKEKEDEVKVEEEGSVMEVSSLYSEERNESEISERDDVGSNLPSLQSCGEKMRSKRDLTKAMVLTVQENIPFAMEICDGNFP